MLARYGYPEQSYFQMKVLHPEKVGKYLNFCTPFIITKLTIFCEGLDKFQF